MSGVGEAAAQTSTSADDIIIDRLGNTFLSGGAGDEVFVFFEQNGNDVITDFSAGLGTGDVIEFRGAPNVTSFNHVQLSATFNGSETVLALSDADSVTLLEINPTDLESGDFLFSYVTS